MRSSVCARPPRSSGFFGKEYSQEIFLNADHTHSLAKAEESARTGFDEIIFDGSGLPFEENVVETKKAVEAIKSIDPMILVEGEIGWIGASSEILDKAPEGLGVLTTPQEATQSPDRLNCMIGFARNSRSRKSKGLKI